jgi:hypothetical protein
MCAIVGQLQDAARAVFEGSERHVVLGEVSDVMEVRPYENCPGDRDRGRGRITAPG